MKNVLFGAVFAFFVVTGSLAASVSIYMLANSCCDLRLGRGLFNLVFVTFPYVWVVFFFVFLLLASYNFRSIKRGYKYKFYLVIIGSIFICVILGTLFYVFGIGKMIESSMRERLPFYQDLREGREEAWLNPEEGLLMGRIMEIDNDSLELRDIQNKTWRVTEIAEVKKGRLELKTGIPIRVAGEKVDDDTFEAEIIRPMMGPPGPKPPRKQSRSH